jgi:hypothetical protein
MQACEPPKNVSRWLQIPGTSRAPSGTPANQRSGLHTSSAHAAANKCLRLLPLARIRPPQCLRPVDGDDRNRHLVALGHANAIAAHAVAVDERARERDVRVGHCNARNHRYRRVHAHRLAHDRVEKRQFVERGECVRV